MLQALISSQSSKYAHFTMEFCFKQQQNTSSAKTLKHEQEKTPCATKLQKCICLLHLEKHLISHFLSLLYQQFIKLLRLDHTQLLAWPLGDCL